LPSWLQTRSALVALALASVVSNVAIVVTGGAVRLTDSGLGCPTWPKCTDGSLTPTKQYAIHGVIEFTNRQLTFVLAIVALATLVVSWVRREQRALATAAALGIPAQAVLGGITVLTHLNPWLVAAHFLLSTVLIAVTFVLWWRLRDTPPAVVRVPSAVSLVGAAAAALTAATLIIGTVVTGSGPHAGDKASDGSVHRTGLQVSSVAQLHADAVMLLVGVTVALVLLLRVLQPGSGIYRAARLLFVVELAQAAIGYTQYFLHVPPLLVGLHMLGACLAWLAALHVVVVAGLPQHGRARVTTAG
jgi:cytochrome c oxidase assembly protein subunit 15